jgi:hypothetical protein
MQSHKCDLLSGKIVFLLSKDKTASEIYDSLSFMKNDIYYKRNAAATANLFVNAIWFKKIGFFPVVKSGGDSLWTSNAVNNGAKLAYSPNTVVYHPARKLYQLTIKCKRVGKGAIKKKLAENLNNYKIGLFIAKHFLPTRIRTIHKLINSRGTTSMKEKTLTVWFVAYICNIFVGIGLITGMLHLLFKLSKNE